MTWMTTCTVHKTDSFDIFKVLPRMSLVSISCLCLSQAVVLLRSKCNVEPDLLVTCDSNL